MSRTEESARKSRLHELKQAWKAARQRWLDEVRQPVPDEVALAKLMAAYLAALGEYMAAKGEKADET